MWVAFIFGTSLVTATIKQLFAFTGWYIEKAKQDSNLAALNCGIAHFIDRVMEGVHKLGKKGKYNFSGGKSSQIGRKQYQEHVIEQQFYNEWFRLEKHDMQCSHEPTKKVQSKLNFDQENPEDITEKTMVSFLQIGTLYSYEYWLTCTNFTNMNSKTEHFSFYGELQN